MSNASGNESDGRGSASAGEGTAEKGGKVPEGKVVEKSKTRGEGDVTGENEGPKNKATGTWHRLTKRGGYLTDIWLDVWAGKGKKKAGKGGMILSIWPRVVTWWNIVEYAEVPLQRNSLYLWISKGHCTMC